MINVTLENGQPADDLSTIFPVFVMKIFCKLILALCLAFEKKKKHFGIDSLKFFFL